ncbi:MAG: hypothetical protein ACKO37_00035 [Vampirovibrionales bacterium]
MTLFSSGFLPSFPTRQPQAYAMGSLPMPLELCCGTSHCVHTAEPLRGRLRMQGLPEGVATPELQQPSGGASEGLASVSVSDSFMTSRVSQPLGVNHGQGSLESTSSKKHWFSFPKDVIKPSETFLTQQVDELFSNKITETKAHPNRMVFFARVGKSLGAAGIHGYQFVTRKIPGFSAAYQHTFVCSHRMCMGKLSCSESTQMAIQTQGPVWGSVWGLMRIMSCAPGVDEQHPVGQLMAEPLSMKAFTRKFQQLRKVYPRWQQWLPGYGVSPERQEVLKRLKKLAWLDADKHYGSWPPKVVRQALAKVGFDWDEQMQPSLKVFPEKQEAWIQKEITRIRHDIELTDQRRDALVQQGVLNYRY